MKKRILFALLAAVMLLSACGKETSGPESELYAVEMEEMDPFYEEMKEKEHLRPFAVMIDNDNDSARPQIGLENAYMVYEIVVEGNATRLMALFKDHTLEKVGPVRSSRHYFLDYALEHDAVYSHAGWSPKAAKDIKSLGVNNINGVAGDGSCFWRDNTYDSSWHNLYTSTKVLSEYAKDKKAYRLETDNAIPDYHTLDTDLQEGEAVLKISLPYANFYKLNYRYNAEKKVYERFIGDKPHASQTGETFAAKNIIMYQLTNTSLKDGENKGRQDISNIGSGTGCYFTNGKMIPIHWEKTARTEKTKYTLEDGSPLLLNPGITYVQIVPTYVTPTFE